MEKMNDKLPKRKPIRKVYEMQIDEADNQSGVFAISLVEDPAIEENWVYMSKQKTTNLAQIAPDKRLLIGPALIPNKLIPRIDDETGEEYDITFTPDVIEKAAHLYMQRQNNNNATLEHEGGVDDISTVESWIITNAEKDKSNQYGMSYPKGTWMVTMKVNNPTIWNDYVKTKKIKGFSIEGMLGHELIKASKIELGYNTTGYDQQTQTRGLAVPPSTYGNTPTTVNPQPFALPPNYGGPSSEDIYANLSNYDGIALTKIAELIKAEYNGTNHDEVLAKIKDMLENENLTWAEFETSVSVGSSYAGQFGNAPEKKK